MKKKPDNLAMEAMAAKRAGMTYGKWKGLQSPVKIEKKIPEGWNICEYCGKAYKPKTKRPQKFCQPYCAYRAAKERQNK